MWFSMIRVNVWVVVSLSKRNNKENKRMMNNDEQQVLALAATIQALTSVHEIATRGKFDRYQATPVLQALVNYSPEDTLAAYGGDIAVLRPGLGQLKHLFSDNLDRDIAQYLLAVVSIELKLVRNTGMRHKLQNSLQAIANRLKENNYQNKDDFFSDDDDEINNNGTSEHDLMEQITALSTIASFAEIYKQTASQTEPRIMIKGNHQNLQNEDSANQIRALLLAALRGAAFFRHYGGKRIDFMMKRKHYLTIAQKLNG